jgi:hypothetical protein
MTSATGEVTLLAEQKAVFWMQSLAAPGAKECRAYAAREFWEEVMILGPFHSLFGNGARAMRARSARQGRRKNVCFV